MQTKEYAMLIHDFRSFIAKHTVKLGRFKQIGTTPFRLNALNGVYAPAKTGKTYFILDQLDKNVSPELHYIWLDGDRCQATSKNDHLRHIKMTRQPRA